VCIAGHCGAYGVMLCARDQHLLWARRLHGCSALLLHLNTLLACNVQPTGGRMGGGEEGGGGGEGEGQGEGEGEGKGEGGGRGEGSGSGLCNRLSQGCQPESRCRTLKTIPRAGPSAS